MEKASTGENSHIATLMKQYVKFEQRPRKILSYLTDINYLMLKKINNH